MTNVCHLRDMFAKSTEFKMRKPFDVNNCRNTAVFYSDPRLTERYCRNYFFLYCVTRDTLGHTCVVQPWLYSLPDHTFNALDPLFVVFLQYFLSLMGSGKIKRVFLECKCCREAKLYMIRVMADTCRVECYDDIRQFRLHSSINGVFQLTRVLPTKHPVFVS